MKCWRCEKQARATCIFCGRAICQEHYQEKANILAVYDEDSSDPQAIIVEGGIWCTICKPIPYPIAVPELERGKNIHASKKPFK